MSESLRGAVLGCLAVATAAVLALLGGGCGKDSGDSSPEQVRKVATIVDHRPRGGGQALVRALGDTNPDVRKAAALGLGDYVAPEHRGAIEQATRDQDPQVRASAAATLSLYKDSASAETLAGLLREDPDEQVRVAAASGLGLNRSDRAIVLLLENAERNSSPAAQYRAMAALMSKLGLRFHRTVDPQDRPQWRALVEEMKHDKVVQAAYAACKATLVFHPEDKMPYAPGHSP